MIRKLLASTAMLALMTAGSFSIAQAQDEPAQTEEPAVVEQEQDASQGAAAETDVAAEEEKLTPEEPTLATAFIGRSVFSSEDPESDNIGEVNDLIISEDGSITHAVVGVGGFLGIGEKDVAVPFEELQVVERDGEIQLVYAATKEQLEAAEEFDRTAYDPGARFAEEQAAMQPDPTAPAGGIAPAPAPVDDMAAAPEPAEPALEEETASADGITPEEESEAAGKTEGLAGDPEVASDEQIAAAEAPAEAEATAEEDMAAADTEADATAEEDMAAADTEADATAEEDLAAADTEADATAEEDMAAADAEAGAAIDGEASFLSFETDQIRASTLMGQEIFGAEEESIGEVSDLVLQEDGETRAAIIDVGGFLGVGEKPVAIAFDQIEVQEQEGGEPRLTVAMTREELEQLPAFEDRTMGAEEDMAAADAELDATTEQPAADATAEVDAAADAEAPEAEQDVAADATADTEATEDIVAEGEVEAGYELAGQDLSAEELIGTTVLGSNDENIGEVGDVIFAESGEIEAVVIDVGGFLGMGEKPVAIQFDALNVQKDTNGDVQLMVNASQEQLESAPTYEAEQAAVQ